jgi:hypothetical protein
VPSPAKSAAKLCKLLSMFAEADRWSHHQSSSKATPLKSLLAQYASPRPHGVPKAQSVPLDSHKAAVALYAAAFSEDLVRRVVEVGGEFDDQKCVPKTLRRPRRSSESSIWGKVTDIDGVATQWGGAGKSIAFL